MKLATSLGFFDGNPDKFANHVLELESAGVDMEW